ncbi:hypothetical protein MVEN_00359700 [Mycena venus]|uniref:F-box domain-containing protein n=1 Tax=Mycena venus TaxID=2733690 RepID=A0A8H6YTI1_9AGAR|nr:hypothetical protein MVEN_00359700 [Mycena venus]
MHRCLLVAEIFSHITYFSTANTRGGLGGKKEVYRLALTCKALSEPALDAVWREISGVTNLIYLLPSDLWHGQMDPQSTSCMTRETVASDWTRFLIHARRVREFAFSSLNDDRLNRSPPWNVNIFDGDTVLRHLHQQCPEVHMLPNLLKLLWNNEVDHIHIFICPTLRSLSLHSSAGYPGVVQLLETQGQIITDLDLKLRVPDTGTDDVVDAVSLAITRMNRLISLQCGFIIRSETLIHLSGLPTLEQIGIPLVSVDDPTSFSAASSTFFPSLTSLIIIPAQPTLFCSLLNAISSTSLDRIYWQITDTDPNNIFNALTILANHGSRHALDSITISASFDLLVAGLPHGLLTLQALRPVLALANLTVLALSVPWLDLGNDDLEEIARHLPQLMNLNLSSHGLVPSTRLTLRGLVPLFEHCSLMFLGLVIDVRDPVPDSEFALPPRPSRRLARHARRLRFLDFGNSRIGPTKVEAIATFLSELVPKLTTLSAWSRGMTELFP